MIITNTTNITDIITQINNTEQQLITAKNTNNVLLYIIIGIIFLTITIGYLYVNNQKKKGQTIDKKKQEIKNIIETLKSLEKEITINKESKKIITLKKIYLDDLPEDTKQELENKDHILNKIFTNDYEKNQPWLLLMRNSGKIEIKKNVKEGLIEIEANDKDKNKKYINITPQKKHEIRINNKKKIIVYIAHEDEAECYPLQPKHHSRSMFSIIQNILLNRTGLIPTKKKISKKLIIAIIIIIIIAIIGYYIYNTYLSHPATTTIVETINNTINNTINSTQTLTTPTNNTVKIINIG